LQDLRNNNGSPHESVKKDGESTLNRLRDAHDFHVPLFPALNAVNMFAACIFHML